MTLKVTILRAERAAEHLKANGEYAGIALTLESCVADLENTLAEKAEIQLEDPG